MECLEKPINFNNSDGSFNRDKWLDFMNTKIDSIGFFSPWTGHTAKIVNQQSKYIDFWLVADLDNDNDIIGITRQYTNFYSLNKDFFNGDRWDREYGWVRSSKDSKGLTFFWFMCALQQRNFNELPKERTLYKVAMDRKTHFVVYMPEHNAVRTLGYWEYAGLGLKKYLYYKIENQLKKLGVL